MYLRYCGASHEKGKFYFSYTSSRNLDGSKNTAALLCMSYAQNTGNTSADSGYTFFPHASVTEN